MVENSFLKSILLLACAAAASSSAGCLAPVVIGGDNTTSTGTATGGAGGTGPTTNAVAMRHDQLPPFPDTGSGGGSVAASTGAGGDTVDPATLEVDIDSGALSCGEPYTSNVSGACQSGWHVTVQIPPAAQHVGTFTMDDGSGVTVLESFEQAGPDCGGGGGNVFDSIQIVSIDENAITLLLNGIPYLDASQNPNGQYTAPRCFVGQQAAVDGIAIPPTDIPDPGTGTSASVGTGGGGGDPNALVVIVHDKAVSDTALACGNPYGPDGDCSVAGWEVSITLPPAYQVPGVYSLSDPALNAGFGEWMPANGDCSGGGGSFYDGTMEVVAIDPTSMVVRFANVSSFAPYLEKDLTISRCQ